jgi:hypothetical protein
MPAATPCNGLASLYRLYRWIIDGKPITWKALGRMVAPNTGFRFKLEIFDRSEEK